MRYKVAVVGATGAVGEQMLRVLEERGFPVGELLPLSSARSAGSHVSFSGQQHTVAELTRQSFNGVHLALFSAGASVSREFAPLAAEAGAWVVDNTSAFRLDADVPLVVPEVNPGAIADATRRIIANPNCSTIQMVVALNPIHQAANIKRVVVSTYQAVSGAGRRAMDELQAQAHAWAKNEILPAPRIFPHPILFECLPWIGGPLESGYTTEEQKMVAETRKIFARPDLRVTATTVRVPVMTGHGESVNIQLDGPLSAAEARDLLRRAPGVQVVDDPSAHAYPLACQAAGTDPVYVGRIRQDPSVPHGLNLWITADNLRKGAALNAVQIAELLFSSE